MKKNANIFVYAVIALFCEGFFSCSNMQDSGAQAVGVGLAASNSAYITIGLYSGVAKTVLPDFQNAAFTDLVLKGAKTGQTQTTLGSWSNASQMQTASIPLELGAWEFTLTANSGGSSFSATAQKEIVAGQNALTFNLALVDGGTQTGSFSISLSFSDTSNAASVTSAVAWLEDMDGNAVSGYSAKNLAINNSAVAFAGSDIAAGTYRARIKFYANSEGTNFELGSYKELVQISSGFCSSASRMIESFDELYTITYVLNGGSFASGTTAPETFTRKTTATLPQNLKRDYYTFCSWHTDISCSDESKVTVVKNSDSDITVYAKWTTIAYKITYDLNWKKIVKTYTVEDDVTLIEPSEQSITIESWWYKDPACETVAESSWLAGDMHDDITFYAKCAINVDNLSIVEKIKAMTCSGTLKATGAFTTNLIRQINLALKELKTRVPDVLVSLDLSEVTGLTQLENAYGPSQQYYDYSFYGCDNLSTILLPNTITYIGNCAFENCSQLKTIGMSSGVTKIAFHAFYNCLFLTSIDLPSALTTIGSAAFDHCSSIKKVVIPGGVTCIDNYTFFYCTSLKEVVLSEGLIDINTFAFNNCHSLDEVTIPNGVKKIESHAFSACKSLKSIVIPNSVEFIGEEVFGACDSLEEITLPFMEYELGAYFSTYPYPTEIEVRQGGQTYYIPSSLKKVTINKGELPDWSVFRNCSMLTDISLPDDLTTIPQYTFYGCSGIETITIPAGVKKIDNYAFQECINLKTVTIPTGCESIGWKVFQDCNSLLSIRLPNTLTNIGNFAFSGCESLVSITIPASVTYLGGGSVFINCPSLVSLVFEDAKSIWYVRKWTDGSLFKTIGRLNDPAKNNDLLIGNPGEDSDFMLCNEKFEFN